MDAIECVILADWTLGGPIADEDVGELYRVYHELTGWEPSIEEKEAARWRVMNAAASGRGRGDEPGRGSQSVRPQLPAERWKRVVGSLEAVRAAGERVTPAVAEAASRLGVSRSTVWAHLRRGSRADHHRAPRPRYTLTREDLAAYYQAGGNAADVARARCGTPDGPGLRTLQRAVAREFGPGRAPQRHALPATPATR
jgi:hypothetical protein